MKTLCFNLLLLISIPFSPIHAQGPLETDHLLLVKPVYVLFQEIHVSTRNLISSTPYIKRNTLSLPPGANQLSHYIHLNHKKRTGNIILQDLRFQNHTKDMVLVTGIVKRFSRQNVSISQAGFITTGL